MLQNVPVDSIEGVSISALAKKYGTPLYIYSHSTLIGNFRRIRDAFCELNPLLAYSMKCNSSQAILRTLILEGAGLDIVSSGELERGLRAGADPKKIVFAGVGKTAGEIASALRAGIRMFNIESEAEAEAIAEVARKIKKPATAALRINPDVDASTHHYITTGKKENKFGIPFRAARHVFARVSKLRGLKLTGLHCHIGSQIMKPTAYVEALGRVIELLDALRKAGHEIRSINLGGGFGIDYEGGRTPMNVKSLAEQLIPLIRPLHVDLIFEPGRSIAGSAGYLLTKVQYVKPGEAKSFAIVDGAMNDLIRPSLYSAYHRIVPVGAVRRGKKAKYDIVGPVCESGDFLGKDREFVSLKAGDMLLVCDAGAYGMAMASNYNSRPRPAEVLVRGNRHHLIRQRESVSDLVAGETIPEFLR